MVNNILINFPTTKVSGCTVICEDGCVSFINTKQSSERQVEAYNHEELHENENDFDKESVQDIEWISHNVGGVKWP